MASLTNCMEAMPPARWRPAMLQAEDGKLVVVEHDHVMGDCGRSRGERVAVEGEAFVLIAPPEGLDLGEVGDVGEQFVEAEDDEAGLARSSRIGQGLDDDLRADAGGVAHGDADGGARDRAQGRRVVGWGCRWEIGSWGGFAHAMPSSWSLAR